MPLVTIQIAQPKPPKPGKMPPTLDKTRLFADLRQQLEPSLRAKIHTDLELELRLGDRGEIKVTGFAQKDARRLAEQTLADLMSEFSLADYIEEV